MPIRIIEVIAPQTIIRDISNWGLEIPDDRWWIQLPNSGPGSARFLVEANQAEVISDQLLGHLRGHPDSRLIILPVEATLPVLEDAPPSSLKTRPRKGSWGNELQRISREEIYEDVAQAAELTPVFMAMVVLSTIVAAIGLIQSSVAIIIGAMVIAPLLGPNMALALSTALGDAQLARRSLVTSGTGVALAALLSVGVGYALPVDPGTKEISVHTSAHLSDIALALASGAAGTLAFTSGVPATVVGVMVAVSLLPPLVVAGLMLGGGQPGLALGALTLLASNVAAVNLAAIATFYFEKVRPRTHWESDRARKATLVAGMAWILILLVLLWFIAAGHVQPNLGIESSGP